MSVSASFDESAVTVEPGDEATISVQVLNSGSTVEELRFEVVGPCTRWTAVEPASLSLYPGRSGTTTLRLHPPRDSGIAPGEMTLGLRVIPTSDANEPVVPERDVTVLPFTEVTAELMPRTSQGAWRGRHKLAVDNRGNTPITTALTIQAGTDRARPVFEPAELTIPPGQTKLAVLSLKPTKRIWRGTPATLPFQATVAPKPVEDRPAEHPVVLDGSYEQQAILPRWLPRALAAAIVVAGILTGLWFGVLRPTVRSAARAAVTPEAIQKAVAAGSGGRSAGSSAGGASGSTTGTNGQTTQGSGASAGASGGQSTGGGGGSVTPQSARLQVQDSVGGGSKSASFPVPAGKTFGLTDIVVQNPQGDAGSVVISTPDGQVLYLALEDFRDSDYHFVTPVQVPADGKVSMSVDCREIGKPVKAPVPSHCSELAFLGGTLQSS